MQHSKRGRSDKDNMNPKLLDCSVAEQRDLLRQSKRIVKNRDERAGYLLELLELVEDEEQLVEYDRQLREVRDERERAAKFAAIIKENLKQIKVGKLEAELREAQEELAEEERKAAKKKADETASTKAKAARRRAKKAEAAARAAVEKGEVERRRRIREERAADQAAARRAAEQAATEKKAAERVREAAGKKKAAARKAAAEAAMCLRRRILDGIKQAPPLKATKMRPSHASHVYARVFFMIRNKPKLKPTKSTNKVAHNTQTQEGNTTRSTHGIILPLHRLEPSSVKTKDQQGNAKVLTNNAKEREDSPETNVRASDDEESIEDMVRRLERELDEEFQDFDQPKSPQPATAAAEAATETAAEVAADVPAIRVPEAAAELEPLKIDNANFIRSFVDPAAESARSRVPEATPESAQNAAAELKTLKNENEKFNNSFVDPAAEPARSRVPETTPVSVQMRTLQQIVPGGPPATNNYWNMEETTEQQSHGDSGNQKPPEMEWYRRPPRARDKNPVHQSQGCRQHLTVSRKGVLDIGYLASGRRPECRPRYRFGAEARVREVPIRLARDWR